MTRDTKTRDARARGKVLVRSSDLSDKEALAVAWKERGYSASGIAKRIGSTEGTVNKRLDRAVAQYGLEAAWPTVEEERGELEEVTPERLLELAPGVRQQWIDVAEDHIEHVPQECREALQNGGEGR